MVSTPTTDDRAFERQLRDMNEALLIASVRQHELAEVAEQANAAAHDSNARFEALFDASPVGMYLVDDQLRIRLVSRTARPVFGDIGGVNGEDLIGSDFVEVIHILWGTQVADAIVTRFRHTLATGEPYVSPEFSEERYDRKVREYYDWQIHRISLPAGRYGVVCYFLDISARVQSAAALRESEERFRNMADNISQLAWTCDNFGNVTWYNQRWLDYTGLSFGDMKGWDWKKVQHPDHVDRVVARVQHSAETGEPWDDTFPLRGKDGDYRWFLSRAMPIRDATGNIVRWFGTNTDVTEQRELEKQISEQAKSLADLHRRKDEFLAMLSHELRNPLAPILNAVQLLHLQRDRTPLQVDAHAMIERQVAQLVRLVDDLLEVARISTGRIHLQEERVDLREIVVRAIETIQPQTGQKGQSVAKSLSDEPLWVFGDPVRLEQVVVNLLNNASKYTDRGGHIWVGLQLEGAEVCLRIRDNGIGIAPDTLPRIFDLFAQAERSLDRAQGGLGVGLALVHSLVAMHHGRVEAHSTVGEGSEFIVRLPLHFALGVTTVVHSEVVAAAPRALRVLVVDDKMDVAKSMANLLRTYGHDTRMANDAATAMQTALEFVPEVVLLDIGLPVVNGYEVAKWFRQQPGLCNAVLIAVTGYGRESDKQRSKEAGFDDHLVKPVDFARVESILSAAADNLH